MTCVVRPEGEGIYGGETMLSRLRFLANAKFAVGVGTASFGKCVAILVCTVVMFLVFSGALATASAQGCPSNGLAPEGGLGTSSSPYRIATLCQLQGISSSLTAHYVQVENIDASTTKDWNGGAGFAPIGATYSTTGLRTDSPSSPSFSGAFDGGGYRISNLFINRPDEDYVGLFSGLSFGTLRAVALRGSRTTGRDQVGSLVGRMLVASDNGGRGMVRDSHAFAKVSGRDRVGGLMGAYAHTGQIAKVPVPFSGNYVVGTVTGRDHVGGLVGDSSIFINGHTFPRIENCFARSTVTGNANVGGLVGSGGRIHFSYATGNVKGNSNVGGLIGDALAVILRSYATVMVSGSTNVGGLLGVNQEGVFASYATGPVKGSTRVGGLIGLNEDIVWYSYATTKILGLTEPDLDLNPSPEEAVRTLAQLRCPTASNKRCSGEDTFYSSFWDPEIWYFGDAETLPVIRLTQPPSAPLRLVSEWLSASTLRLRWNAPEVGNTNIKYQVDVGALASARTRSTSLDVGGADLEYLRKERGGSSLASLVRGSNHFSDDPGPTAMTEVRLLNVPGTPTTVTVSETGANTVRVTVGAPDNDGYGRKATNTDYGSAVDDVDLNFAYAVSVIDMSGTEIASLVRETTSTSAVFDFAGLDLKPGTQYRIVTSARNVVGEGGELESVFTTNAVNPGTPTLMVPVRESTQGLALSWTVPYDGGSTITAYVVTVGGGTPIQLGSTTMYVVDLTALRSVFQGGDTIFYSVRAVNAVGGGNLSTGTFVLLNVPGTPTSVAATGMGTTAVQVTVTGPDNDGYGRGTTDPDYGSTADDIFLNFAYVVSVIDGSGKEIASMVSETTSTSVIFDFVDLDLEPGTQYRIVTSARNVVGEGDALEVAFTTNAKVPDAPIIASVWETTQRLVFSWGAPYDGGSTITKYRFSAAEGRPGAGSTDIPVVQTTLVYIFPGSGDEDRPFGLRGVQGGDRIEAFQLQAVNATGAGSPSAGTFVLLDVPGTPTVVSASETGVNTVRVTVNAPDNDGYGRKATNTTTYGSQVDKVDLEFAYVVNVIDGSGKEIASMVRETTSTSEIFDFAGLEPGTLYTVKAFAQNAVGVSDALARQFTTNAVKPGAPVLLEPVWETTQRLVLSWTAPDDGGSAITTYVVTVGGDAPIQLGSTTMYVVDPTALRSGYTGGDAISYSVRADNSVGGGNLSAGEFTLLDIPGTPTTVTVLETGANTVRVTVNAPDNDGYGRGTTETDYGSKVDEIALNFAYVVSVIDGSGKEIASTVKQTRSTSVSLVLGGLEPGIQYRIVTFARNAVGKGDVLESAFTTRAVKPGTPVLLEPVWKTTQSLALSWTAPDDGGSAITAYVVTGGGDSPTQLGSTTVHVVDPTALRSVSQGGAAISYSVRAVNAEGDGDPSASKFILLDVPGTPTTVTVSEIGTTTVRVTVNAPDNDGYGRGTTETDYGSKVDEIALNFAYVVSVINGSGKEIASMVRETTSTSEMFDFAGLEPGTLYTVKAFAQNAVGAGGELEGEFTTNAVKPGAPVLLEPVWKTTQSLVLSWTAPDDGGSTITAYVVTVGGDTPAESTTRLDSDPTMLVVDPTVLRSVFQGGAAISYSVRAVNATGAGSPSAGTFVLLDVPGTPTVVSASEIGVNTVRVTVNAPDNDGYGRKATNTTTYGSQVDKVDLEFAYVVSVIDGSGKEIASMVRETTSTSEIFDFADLEPGTLYTVKAFAQNAVGVGDALEREFTTNAVKPGTPVLLEPVWETTQRLVLSWTAPDDGGSTITTYVVTAAGGTPIQLGSTTMYVVDHTALRSGYTGGDTISYSVRAVNAEGDGSPSAGKFTLLDVPGTPTTVTVSETGATNVRVTVNAPDNDGYGRGTTETDYGSKVDEIALNFAYVVSVIDGSGKEIASMVRETTSTSEIFDFADLEPGTLYTVKAFAQNAVGVGDALEREFTTNAVKPGTPVLLEPVWETTQRLVLSWTAPDDGGSTITTYVVTAAGGTPIQLGSTTMYVVDHTALRSGYTGGDTISYLVRAVNAEGDGSPSAGKFTLLDVPGTPTTVTVSETGATNVRVTVNAPDNDGYGRGTTETDYGSKVDEIALNFAYVVSVIDGSGKEIASTVKQTRSTSESLVLGGLEPGIQYRIVTFARNAVGKGDVLESAFTTRAVKPGTPVLLEPVWKTTQSLALSWTAPDDGGSAITAYVVTGGGDSPTQLGSTTMHVVDPTALREGFQGGVAISYSVRAVNAEGDGVPSAGTFVLLDVPATPTVVSASETGVNTVRVTVNAPDNDGYGRKATNTTTYGSQVDKVDLEFAYVVNVIDGSGKEIASMVRETTSTSEIFDFAGLEPGTLYTVKAFAQNAVGAGDALAREFTTNAVKPGTPVLLEPVWKTTQSLALSWTAPDDGGSAITAYVVTGGGDSPTQLGSTTMHVVDPTALREGFQGGVAISYSVRAANAEGDGDPSAGKFTLLDVPGTPTTVTVSETGATNVRVTVNAPDNDGYGRKATNTTTYGSQVDKVDLEFAYVVNVIDGSGKEIASMVRETTSTSEMFDFAGLEPGTLYTVKAFAQNAVGAGDALAREFTTNAVKPGAPVLLEPVWKTTQSLVLSWTAPYDGGSTITTYVVTGGGNAPVRLGTTTRHVVEPTALRSVSQGGAAISYSVRAVNAEGGGDPSAGTFVLLDVPATPTAVSASETGVNTVRVTVNAPDNDGYGRKATNTTTYGSQVDKVDLEFAYVVNVIDGSGKEIASTVKQTRSTSVSLVLGGLEPGTQYRIVTFARNAVGKGDVLESAFTTRAVKPGTPVLLEPVWKTTQSLVLSWTVPYDGGSDITAYMVTGGGNAPVRLGTTTRHVVDPTILRKDFQGGVAISYSVRAVNAEGDGDPSTGKFTLLDVPGTPTTVTVSETGATNVRVTVNAPDNDGYGRKATNTTTYGSQVDKVDLEFAYVVNVIDGSGKEIASMVRETTSTSEIFDFAGLEPGTLYTVKALAQNAAGVSDALARQFTTNAVKPGTPVLLEPVWKTTQSLALSWTVPDDGGSAITTYVVTVGGDAPIQLGSTTMYVVEPTALRSVSQGGVAISYSVRADNSVGGGNLSAGEFTLLDIPGTPTTVTVSEIGANTVRVTVGAPDNDGYGRKATNTTTYGSQVDMVDLEFAYVVSVIGGSGKEIASMVSGTTSTSVVFDFTGLDLEPWTQYRIVTSARNAVGAGGELESVFTTRAVKPGTPVLLEPVWKTTQSLALSWTAPDDGGSAITTYVVTVGGDALVRLSATTRYVVDPTALRKGFQGGDAISYSVRADNSVGGGNLSAGKFTLLDVPGTPTSIAATGMGTTAVQVTVGAPDNDGYGRKATDTTTYGSIVDDRVALELTYKVSILSGDQIVSSMTRTTTEASVVFDFAGLDFEPGTQYRIVSTARNAVGKGDALESVFTTNAVKPGTPTLMVPVRESTQSLALSWTAPYDGGSAVTTYVVTVGGGTPIQLGSTTMYVVDLTALRSVFQGGDKISYSVQAVNAEGVGNLSNGTFVLLNVPGTPTSVTATVMGTTTVQVTVIGPDNDGYGRGTTDPDYGSTVDGDDLKFAYVVNVIDGSDTVIVSMVKETTSTSETFDFAGLDLEAGTQYRVVTSARNVVGQGGAIEGGFMTEGTSPTDSVRLRLRGYLGGAVR